MQIQVLIPETEVTKKPWKGHFNIDPNEGRDLKKCLLEIMYLTFWVGVTFSLYPKTRYQKLNYQVWLVVSNIFFVHPYLGKWANLTNIFEMGWNHQPEV